VRGFESPEAFAALVSPHLPVLVRQARAIVGSDDLAWDAVQETLLRLWNRGWLPPDPRGVLAHLVQRSALHLLRCQTRRRSHEGLGGLAEDCCADDPLREVETGELRATLRAAIARLAAEFRVVFELHELEGQSYEEIANALGIPVGTVRSRLSRARARLREDLASMALEGS
jgi:RNA polymerase sigma-70 factor (ECF subfamily)